MAGQYLQRNPTSTGNRSVFTWSGWVKHNKLNTVASNNIWYVASAGNSEFRIFITNTGNLIVSDYIPSPQGIAFQFQTERLLRDHGNWFHLLVSVDTTKDNGADRVKIYVNGVSITEFSSTTYGNQNHQTRMNMPGEVNYLGQNTIGGGSYQAFCELFDVFSVDGQALTPEVFGFYKDGNGYISAGSAQATDFRNGQWVPRTPREIKNLINDNGGFGVNGFYLPMNDSSNPGADFHCAPNSIIKLKGEDLPQPRNGAPTTSDDYVSQLRTDPYAANLVLAVPGISTSTSATLVTNGTFDSGITGWSNWNATLSYDTTTFGSSIKIVDNGGQSRAYQVITTEVGKRYTATADIKVTGGNSLYDGMYLYTDVTDATTNSSGNNGFAYSTAGTDNIEFTARISFTATTTTTVVVFTQYSTTATTYVKNVVVKQEDAPRDYSADIKGSGTNKTLTAVGNAGVGYELGGYYGSAMTFDGTGDYFNITPSNFNDVDFGTGDFTVECWAYGTGSILAGPGPTDGSFLFSVGEGDDSLRVGSTVTAWRQQSAANVVKTGQWNHLSFSRENGIGNLFVNGVCVSTAANAYNYDLSPDNNYFIIGSRQQISGTENPGFVPFNGQIQDVRVYKGVAKYKGGFDVPKPYTPVGIEAFRTTADTCKNNFATMNALNSSTNVTLSEGNLNTVTSNAIEASVATVGVSTRKWYWEVNVAATPILDFLGITGIGHINDGTNFYDANQLLLQGTDGSVYHSSFHIRNTTSWGNGDIVKLKLDLDNQTLEYGVNNGSYVGLTKITEFDSHVAGETWLPTSKSGSTGGNGAFDHVYNFGQNPSFGGRVTAGTYTDSNGKGLFKYQPPSGFLALCEDNLPEPTIKDPGEHFKTILWTGDGNGGRSITGVGFQPDLVWVKRRNAAASHFLVDSVRGAGKFLQSHATAAEGDDATNTLMSFDSNGFTSGNTAGMNASTDQYVAWCWKAGGPAVTNTDGSINSVVSANQTAGFSIATWTSTGSNDALQTVGHGLDTAPNMIILKNRSAAVNWRVYHSGIPSPNNSLCLNTTEVAFNFFPSVGDDTFGLANSTTTGQSSGASGQDIVAYCWSEIEGFSKFGSYIGNGDADGPFVYCGFKPAFLLLKIASPAGQERDWHIYDSARSSTNPVGLNLRPSSNAAEVDEPGIDFLSNGFKIRQNYVFSNYNGGTYIFAAFAESPFQTANAK
jgi:hypothetical protein